MSRTNHSHGGLLSAALIAGLAFVPAAAAQNCDQCKEHPCPPKFKYIFEGAPKIKFKRGCPKPLCDPCNLPHYGYFQPCWHPWAFPPDWSHCPVPPPGALVPADVPPGRRFLNEPPKADETPPMPRRDDDRPSGVAPPAAPPAPFRADTGLAEQTVPVGVTGRSGGAERPPAQYLPPPSLPPLAAEGPPAPKPPESPAPLPPAAAQESAQPRGLPTAEPPRLDPGSPFSMRDDGSLAPSAPPASPPNPIAQTAAVTPPAVPPDAQRPRKINSGPAGATMRMVNSRRILLDCDLAEVPTPEQTVLELWFTQDGRTWERDQATLRTGSPYMVEVNREGTYGFLLIARKIGEPSEPPAQGQAPDVWVEVDWTKPVIHMVHARPGEGGGRQLAIAWVATDNNLSPQPVTLSWAETPEGPWRTFASQVENSGRYLWQVPGNVPSRVHVRVEAFDLVGNAGSAHTPTPVVTPGMP